MSQKEHIFIKEVIKMEKLIILKYGELWLKSERTKKKFLEYLKNHLESIFTKDKFYFKRDRVEVKTKNFSLLRFKYIPGIEYAQLCYKVNASLDEISSSSLEVIRKENLAFSSFAVRCKRSGKHNFRSKDVEIKVGALIKEQTNAKVDLEEPDFILKIEVVDADAYIIFSSQECIGGLPYASEGSCRVDGENYFLITEVLKRGLYIENLPSDLRFYYPVIKNHKKQYFDVEIYSWTLEELIQKDISKKEGKLTLAPLIIYNSEEIKSRSKQIKEEFKKIKDDLMINM